MYRMTQPDPNPKAAPARLCAYGDCDKRDCTITAVHNRPGAHARRPAFCSPLHLILWELQQMKRDLATKHGPEFVAVDTAEEALAALDLDLRREEGSTVL